MKHSAVLTAAGLLFAATLSASPALALNARSFVSGHGLDSNACTLTAPCRTFAAAFAATNAGGEIDVLDTAGYGPLTINKAISIVNDGSIASVLVPSGGTGITISAGTNDAVSLRGLTIEGAGTGATGIQFNTGSSLTIENCIVRHVSGDGIDFLPTASSNLSVSNTLVADNANNGIIVYPSGAGTVTAVFNHVEANNNAGIGILVDGANGTGTIKATVSDSVAAHNGTGFHAETATSQAPTTLIVFHSVSANNSIGFTVLGVGATLRLAQSVVTGNPQNGWNVGGSGVFASYGDNYIDGNGSNSGSLSPINKQ